MTVIKIFVASSIEKFAWERAELARWVLSLNNRLVDKGYYIMLELCENENSSMSYGRKQEEYNGLIRESDAVLVLATDMLGEYTYEEFEVAMKARENDGRPYIQVFFRGDEEAANDKAHALLDRMGSEDIVYTHEIGTLNCVKGAIKNIIDLSCKDLI